MYANKLAFPNVTKSLNFVTNAQFRMSLKPDGKETEVDQFELKQLTDEIGKKYSDAVRKEHKLSEELADVPTIFFTEALPHNGHEDQTRGRFAAFLEKKNPKGKFAVSAAFRTIASVIAKRTGEERQPSSRESLLLLKAITRANFSEMLATIMEEDEEDRWKDIGVALISEQYAYGYIQRLRGAWNKYHVQQMDAANTPVQRLKESAIEIATDFVREKPEFKLRELIDEGVPLLRQSLGAACPFDDHSLSAALIYHCHENESLSPTVA
jgi:hypothetical protein